MDVTFLFKFFIDWNAHLKPKIKGGEGGRGLVRTFEIKASFFVRSDLNEQLLFCRLHDFDNNTMLDGLEIYKALTHLLPFDQIQDETVKVDTKGKTAFQIKEEQIKAEQKYYTGTYCSHYTKLKLNRSIMQVHFRKKLESWTESRCTVHVFWNQNNSWTLTLCKFRDQKIIYSILPFYIRYFSELICDIFTYKWYYKCFWHKLSLKCF